MIGPWDHAGTRTPKREFAGLIFGEASLVDMNKLHLEWRRLSLQEENLIPVGEIMRYEFNGFTFFFHQIAKGSRLRLRISSPNSIAFQKNYNSGGTVADESRTGARTVQVKLYHSSEHPSFLEIPIVCAEKG